MAKAHSNQWSHYECNTRLKDIMNVKIDGLSLAHIYSITSKKLVPSNLDKSLVAHSLLHFDQ